MTDVETLRWTARNLLPLKQGEWLQRAMEILRVDFDQIGEFFPKLIDINVDYPKYQMSSWLWLGCYLRCWFDESGTHHHEIFINPAVNGIMALDILVHELVHAVVGEPDHCERFHGVAAAIGLDDTGSTAGAEEVLLRRLRDIQEMLGPYPLVFDCLEVA